MVSTQTDSMQVFEKISYGLVYGYGGFYAGLSGQNQNQRNRQFLEGEYEN